MKRNRIAHVSFLILVCSLVLFTNDKQSSTRSVAFNRISMVSGVVKVPSAQRSVAHDRVPPMPSAAALRVELLEKLRSLARERVVLRRPYRGYGTNEAADVKTVQVAMQLIPELGTDCSASAAHAADGKFGRHMSVCVRKFQKLVGGRAHNERGDVGIATISALYGEINNRPLNRNRLKRAVTTRKHCAVRQVTTGLVETSRYRLTMPSGYDRPATFDGPRPSSPEGPAAVAVSSSVETSLTIGGGLGFSRGLRADSEDPPELVPILSAELEIEPVEGLAVAFGGHMGWSGSGDIDWGIHPAVLREVDTQRATFSIGGALALGGEREGGSWQYLVGGGLTSHIRLKPLRDATVGFDLMVLGVVPNDSASPWEPKLEGNLTVGFPIW